MTDYTYRNHMDTQDCENAYCNEVEHKEAYEAALRRQGAKEALQQRHLPAAASRRV